MQRRSAIGKLVAALVGVAYGIPACVSENATAVVRVEHCDADCGAGGHAREGLGGHAGGGDGALGGASGSGGEPGDGGRGGAKGSGGVPATGGALATGGAASELDASASGDATSQDFSLVVDAPVNGAALSGVVTVRGRATVYQNVEVWDATHQMPPLAQVTPGRDGAFSVKIDTAKLPEGPTTWTVWAWNSPPGQPFDHSERVTLELTIGASDGGDSGASLSAETGAPAKGPAPADAAKVGGDISLPASSFPITYEIGYSRVYLR